MARSPDPERELVRRGLPFAAPAALLAMIGGTAAAGWQVGVSAALGIAVVALNFLASGILQAWAANLSLTMLAIVVTSGFVVRMSVILAIMFLLDRLTAWFIPLAFGLAVVPALALLLSYELKLFASGAGRELIIPAERRA